MIFLWKLNNALNMVIIITVGCEEKHSFCSAERGRNQILSLICPSFFCWTWRIFAKNDVHIHRREKNPFYFSMIVQLSSTLFLITACSKAMLPNVRLFSWPEYRVRNWKTILFCERLKCWCLMTPRSICGCGRVLRPGLHPLRVRGEILGV